MRGRNQLQTQLSFLLSSTPVPQSYPLRFLRLSYRKSASRLSSRETSLRNCQHVSLRVSKNTLVRDSQLGGHDELHVTWRHPTPCPAAMTQHLES